MNMNDPFFLVCSYLPAERPIGKRYFFIVLNAKMLGALP
jgi:hypothetical protein